MKIFGVSVVKNEWPLIAVSVAHALANDCDEVIVIDNGSTDFTLQGLQNLRDLVFGGRLHIFQYPGKYVQASITGAAIQLARHLGADYVLAFDADEFLIIQGDDNLSEVLTQAPEIDLADSIQIHLQNFVVPNYFDEYDLSSYSEIVTRVVPTQKQAGLSGIELQRMILADEVGLLDNHFWNFKVVVKTNKRSFTTSGNHRTIRRGKVIYLDPEKIIWGHIPYVRPSKVIRRNHDKEINQSTVHYGLLDSLANIKSDREIWELVSVDENQENPRIPLTKDDKLGRAVERAVKVLTPYWDRINDPERRSNGEYDGTHSGHEAALLATLIDVVYEYIGKDFTDQIQIP